MKKCIFIVACLLATYGVLNAQDVIITKSDEMIKAFNLEIGNNAVFYQASQAKDAPILKIAKSDIFIIKLEDGSKLDPNAEEKNGTPSNNEGSTMSSSNQSQSLVARSNDEQRKQELIRYFSPILTYSPTDDYWGTYKSALKKLKPRKKEKTFPLYAQFAWHPSAESEICNEDLEFSFGVCNVTASYIVGNAFIAKLVNRTNQIIYVDLANSFTIDNSGEATAYYGGKIISTTNGRTSGTSFNLGGITNALGIGGPIGALANATSVGSASSSTTTTMNIEQRIVSIPPGASIELKDEFYPPCIHGGEIARLCVDSFKWEGDLVDIPESIAPKMSYVITYSLTPDFAQYSTLNCVLVPYKAMLSLERSPEAFQYHFLTSSMRHPNYDSPLDRSKSGLIARCFSVKKSVLVK